MPSFLRRAMLMLMPAAITPADMAWQNGHGCRARALQTPKRVITCARCLLRHFFLLAICRRIVDMPYATLPAAAAARYQRFHMLRCAADTATMSRFDYAAMPRRCRR